ncbi:hypothetical protein MUP01_12760 [Candidatus Bathyarchaeota archaeon]|nr:hypothetical protein [Candidatus Bathyarchaeota archaeon]
MTGKPRPNDTRKETLGIPEVLKQIQFEKLTAPLPVKLWPSLANYVRQHGGSQLIRTALLAYLHHNTEGS